MLCYIEYNAASKFAHAPGEKMMKVGVDSYRVPHGTNKIGGKHLRIEEGWDVGWEAFEQEYAATFATRELGCFSNILGQDEPLFLLLFQHHRPYLG